jgi:acyl-[acyl-carrier-protein]-phospholipid O-acyltransferase/long-chain-fatty-acid--[acyl-carrier-protein] ligase
VILERDGLRWYRSGDKGHLDDDGFLTIVDRYSRFAKLSGEMVSLAAVEGQIRRACGNPEMDVCALSVPDSRKGEQIILLAAGVSLDLQVLRRQLLDEGCSPLTIPHEILDVETIPKLGSGKTDFGAARKLADSLRAALGEHA